jgi:F-type H+-transporting ATPase subunit alpha
MIYAGTRGYLDTVPVDEVGQWKDNFARWLHAEHQEFIDSLEREGKWDDEVENRVKEVIEAYNRQSGVQAAEQQPATAAASGA